MSLISLRSADIGYPDQRVLDGVSLEIEEGAFVGIVGGNGSGKTTLLRTLLGVVPVLSGRLQRAPGLRLGYVPQQLSLDDRFPLSAREVVTMGLWRGARLLGRIPAQERERVRNSLERVGMLAHAERSFRKLSGGQRQRVLVARALASQAQLLFLDEPTAGVDRSASRAIYDVLRELRAGGVTLAVVTHHPAQLEGELDPVWSVGDGQVSVSSHCKAAEEKA